MAFRNPVYLDLQLLENLADYYGIELQGESQVTRRTLDERRGRAGVSRGVDVGRERGATEEVTEVYATSMRPVRAMNDVIDHLLRDKGLVDLAADPSAAVSQRDVVQIDGSLSLSPVTEIGALMAALTPHMLAQASSGGEVGDLDPTVIGQIIMGDQTGQNFLHVFDVDTQVADLNVLVLVAPGRLFGNATMEDLDGELTILGTVDRVVQEGNLFSLERHLMPGINRTARRAMGTQGMSGLLESFSQLLGKDVDAAAISVAGPAILLTPVAIY